MVAFNRLGVNKTDVVWDRKCKRCGIGCTYDYCHDCLKIIKN